MKASTNCLPGYRQRPARIEIHRAAVLIEEDGCQIPVVILDVSRDGFRLHSRDELEIGGEVSLLMAKAAPVRARIQWTRGFEAGGTFLDSVAL